MAEHVGHAWMQPCREYDMGDGTTKGICAITSDEAVRLLREYVQKDVERFEAGHVPLTYESHVVGTAHIEETEDGVMVTGTIYGPATLNLPHNMSIREN